MKKPVCLLLTASVFLTTAAHAQEDKPSNKMESQQIIIQQKGNGSESLSIQIDGDDVTVNGKPLSEHDDKNVIVKKKKMIISDGEKIIYDSDSESKNQENEKPGKKKAFLGVTSETGEKVASIIPVSKESAAEKAGLQRGDVITKINSTKIEGPESLTETISQCKPGEEIKIRYTRDGKEKSVKTELGERTEAPKSISRSFSFTMPQGDIETFRFPEMEGSGLDEVFRIPDLSDLNIGISGSGKPKLGLKIQDVEKGGGVKVLGVEENSASAKAGIKKDDVIISINDQPVSNTDDAREQLKETKAGNNYKMKLMRDGRQMEMEVSIPAKLKTIDL